MEEHDTTIVVSNEMRRLFAAMRSGSSAEPDSPLPRPSAGSMEPPLQQGDAPDLLTREYSDERAAGPSRKVCLRRDGQRPLVFDGMALLSCQRQSRTPGLDLQFDLYLADDGQLVAALAVQVAEDGPKRPVHAAERIGSAIDLDSVIEDFDPALAFPAWTPVPQDVLATIGTLRAEVRQLSACVRGAG